MTAIPPFPGVAASIAQADRRATEVYSRFFDQLVKALTERLSMVTSTVAPTVNDIPDGEFRVWKDTGAGTIRLYANNGGVLVSTLLS